MRPRYRRSVGCHGSKASEIQHDRTPQADRSLDDASLRSLRSATARHFEHLLVAAAAPTLAASTAPAHACTIFRSAPRERSHPHGAGSGPNPPRCTASPTFAVRRPLLWRTAMETTGHRLRILGPVAVVLALLLGWL